MIGSHRGKENVRTFGFMGGKAWTRVGIGGHVTVPTLTEITASILRRAPVARTYTHPTSGLGATRLLCNDKRILRPSLDFCSTSRNNYALVTAGGEHSTLENLRVSDKIAPHRSRSSEFEVDPVGWRAAPQRVAIYGSAEEPLFHMQGDWS